MLLYTCAMKKVGATTPLIKHPCAVAAKALDDAGHTYDLETVAGFKNVPFTRAAAQRKHIIDLTGQPDVPVLVLDDGTTVDGHKAIVAWAKEHPAG